MANALHDWYRQQQAEKGTESVAWLTDTIKVMLLDLDVSEVAVKQIGSSTNATPVVVTSTAHGFSNGDKVSITGHLVNTSANGLRKIKNVTANTYELVDAVTGADVAGVGIGVATGRACNLRSVGKYLADWDGCKVSGTTDQVLGSKTSSWGALFAAATTWLTVAIGTWEAALIYKDTGSPATSVVIGLVDTAGGLPVTSNLNDIIVTWDAVKGLLEI